MSVEAQIKINTETVRARLRQLEDVLVSQGHARPVLYNSRLSGHWSRGRRGATVIQWADGKIRLVVGEDKSIGVDEMDTENLIEVATHMAPFVDNLESRNRHLLAQLTDAERQLSDLLDRVHEET